MKENARKLLTIEPPFNFKNGLSFDDPITVAYETLGELNAKKSNAILITTGLSPSAHIASSEEDESFGWWENIVGKNKPIDTDKYFVICVNSLGSCFGSSGPSSKSPGTAKRYKLSFPEISIADIAFSIKPVLEKLRIKKLSAIIGPSMGGMTALSFIKQFPNITHKLVLISAAASSRPFSIALRSLQRLMITSDPDWKAGDYSDADLPLEGMKHARFLGMITYRSPTEWNKRFGRKLIKDIAKRADLFGNRFQIQDYLKRRSDDFIIDFDPNSYLYLSNAIDAFDLTEDYKNIEEAIETFNLDRVLIIGVEEDYIFPYQCQEDLYSAFKSNKYDVKLLKLPSINGHDSFLVDHNNFGAALADFFK
jgi:homoserine O-acetyltransferase